MTGDNSAKKEARIEAFKKIADAKGFTFRYSEDGAVRGEPPISGAAQETRKFHFDALMVDQSIRDAIVVLSSTSISENAEPSSSGSTSQSLVQKLQRLLETGSAYEKAMFSMSSDTYYFPEDVNAMAASAARSENSISGEQSFSCQSVCYTVCRCIGTHQDCKDMCRWVCNGAKD